MIKLVRCDDRMIHGQCITRVLGDFDINRIVGVDDFTANNPTLKSIYQMVVPPTVKSDILTVEETAAVLPQHIASEESVLLLMKSPEVAERLFSVVPGLKKELNIGPMSNRPSTKKVTRYAYFTAGEVGAINKMIEMGVRVYFNQLIDQMTDEWKDVMVSF